MVGALLFLEVVLMVAAFFVWAFLAAFWVALKPWRLGSYRSLVRDLREFDAEWVLSPVVGYVVVLLVLNGFAWLVLG